MKGRLILWGGLAALVALVVTVQLDRQAYNDPSLLPLVPGPLRAVAEQRRLELAIALAGRAGELIL